MSVIWVESLEGLLTTHVLRERGSKEGCLRSFVKNSLSHLHLYTRLINNWTKETICESVKYEYLINKLSASSKSCIN